MGDLTHDQLKARLRYDPDTGQFIRLKAHKRSLVGKPAGYAVTSRAGVKYLHIDIGSKNYKAHRLAWFYMTGQWPNESIDHKDRDGLNNRWGNLREATRSQNLGNRRRNINNTSGFKGVSPHHGRWRARINIDSQRVILGVFDTPAAAHDAYVQAAKKVFGEFARAG